MAGWERQEEGNLGGEPRLVRRRWWVPGSSHGLTVAGLLSRAHSLSAPGRTAILLLPWKASAVPLPLRRPSLGAASTRRVSCGPAKRLARGAVGLADSLSLSPP